MRAAGITALGEPVEILEVDEPAPPGAHEVLVDVSAAGIGNWDELVRIGSRPRLAPGAPWTLDAIPHGVVVRLVDVCSSKRRLCNVPLFALILH